MIDITRISGKPFTLNSDLIETIEESPDTVVTLTTGKKIIVKEGRQEIQNLVILYKREIYRDCLISLGQLPCRQNQETANGCDSITAKPEAES